MLRVLRPPVSQVDALVEKRNVLRERAAVAHSCVDHCEALIALSNAIQARPRDMPAAAAAAAVSRAAQGAAAAHPRAGAVDNSSGSDDSRGSADFQPADAVSAGAVGAGVADAIRPESSGGGSEGSTCGGARDSRAAAAGAAGADAARAPHTSAQWQQEVSQMRCELEAASVGVTGPQPADGPGGTVGPGAGAGVGPHLEVDWWPRGGGAAAVARAARPEALTLGAFRALVLDCMRHFGVILP
jgi:hypothetical protein